jgi:hypothetical protein
MFAKVRRVLWRIANPMKLIVHIGLHKTGSTYLQHILNTHSEVLKSQGLYYQHQFGYPAHHDLAWELLRGENRSLVKLIDEARRENCSQLMVSSEDLEGILYDNRPLEAIQRAAVQGRVTEIEYHVVLREPGAAFASLFRELAKHTYSDPLSLFYSVMRRGFIHMVEPGGGVPYWYYSFDQARDLKEFARRASGKLQVHDFKDSDPFPGWRIISDYLGSIESLPDSDARNDRNSDEVTLSLFQERLAEVGASKPVRLDEVDDFAATISKHFAQSHADALAL